MTRRIVLSLVALYLAVQPGRVLAEDIVLTLTNTRISAPHGTISFTREELTALEQATISTGNDFIDGVSEFRGPAASKVIDMIGRAGMTMVRLTSLSDFFVEVSIEELLRYGVILALEQDGAPLERRGKGPIWLIYPIDLYPELQDSVYNSRQIWQLRTIELF